MLNIVVLVSGGGTNLQALINGVEYGMIQHGKITKVISSKSGVLALTRAELAGIDTAVVERAKYKDNKSFSKALLAELEKAEPDLIVLAGFMQILSKDIVKKYENKIINIHPALIPSFCGKGYYGLKVHEAALKYGVKVTGATVHYVNEIPDGGAIIDQKAVEIKPDDTPETLQKRVMQEAEWVILPKAVGLICDERYKDVDAAKKAKAEAEAKAKAEAEEAKAEEKAEEENTEKENNTERDAK